MPFRFAEIVPWGRSYDEYCRMFDLTPFDLRKKILGCGDGPASFNAGCNAQGGNVVSIDPIYAFSREWIATKINETFDNVISQTHRNREKFHWDQIASVEELGSVRMAAMKEFLADYEQGKAAGRYVAGSLPVINFSDDWFDISLSAHVLFFYSDHLSFDFHVESINEMLRVAQEVRIFPLLDFNARRSSYVDRIITRFDSHPIEIRKVNYEFQIGGNEMMVISRKPADR